MAFFQFNKILKHSLYIVFISLNLYAENPMVDGNIHLGFELENGVNEKHKKDFLLNLNYQKEKEELQLYLDYAYETTKTENRPKVENKDELIGVLTYQKFLENKHFYYASIAGDYDRPKHILNRYIPSLGYGKKYLFAGQSKWVEPSLGIGYATTEYTEHFPEKNFAVLALKLQGNYKFEKIGHLNNLTLDGFAIYYPHISSFSKDWIFRSKFNLTLPIYDFFSVKLATSWINDSNPDPTIGNNKTTYKLLFGFDF